MATITIKIDSDDLAREFLNRMFTHEVEVETCSESDEDEEEVPELVDIPIEPMESAQIGTPIDDSTSNVVSHNLH
jgi:hypothetical protein